jgi:RNA polymerase sigma factor (sigma-70 family)
MNYSDAELLKGLLARDEKILRVYYVKYFEMVRCFIRNNNGSEEDARDIFQDTLLVLFQKVRKETIQLTCSLGTYLYSISRYLWLKELARRRWIAHNPVDLDEFFDATADIGQISEQNERLFLYRLHFDKLSEDCQQVLNLFMEGHSIAEITLLMGYSSEQYTRNRRYRCKSSLIRSIRATIGKDQRSNGNDEDN